MIATWEILKYSILYDVFCAVVLSSVFSFPGIKIVLEEAYMKYEVTVHWEPFAATNTSKLFTCRVIAAQTVGGDTNQVRADGQMNVYRTMPKEFSRDFSLYIVLKHSRCRAFCKELSPVKWKLLGPGPAQRAWLKL